MLFMIVHNLSQLIQPILSCAISPIHVAHTNFCKTKSISACNIVIMVSGVGQAEMH